MNNNSGLKQCNRVLLVTTLLILASSLQLEINGFYRLLVSGFPDEESAISDNVDYRQQDEYKTDFTMNGADDGVCGCCDPVDCGNTSRQYKQ